MKRLFVTPLLALLCIPLGAQAQSQDSQYRGPGYSNSHYSSLSYTLGEVRLLAQDPDGGDDADGVRLGGSALVSPDLFVAGALSTLGSDSPNGLDTDIFELGLGYRYGYTPRIDFVGIGGIVRVDRDFGGRADDDDWGPSLTGGVRAIVAPLLEVGGFVNYTELFGDGDLGLIGEGLYHLTPNLAFLGGLGVSDDDRSINLGARWNFTPTR